MQVARASFAGSARTPVAARGAARTAPVLARAAPRSGTDSARAIAICTLQTCPREVLESSVVTRKMCLATKGGLGDAMATETAITVVEGAAVSMPARVLGKMWMRQGKARRYGWRAWRMARHLTATAGGGSAK